MVQMMRTLTLNELDLVTPLLLLFRRDATGVDVGVG